jgi:hypothetical protein
MAKRKLKKAEKVYNGLEYGKLKISYNVIVSVFLIIGFFAVIMFNFSWTKKDGIEFNPIHATVEIKKEFKK